MWKGKREEYCGNVDVDGDGLGSGTASVCVSQISTTSAAIVFPAATATGKPTSDAGVTRRRVGMGIVGLVGAIFVNTFL